MSDPSPEPTPTQPPNDDARALYTPRKLILQTIFWLFGLGLLIWIIQRAIETGNWEKIAQANPWLIVLLVGCTILSTLFNGATFWITIRPLRRVGFWNMQWLSIVGNMLNYGPIRAGAIARVLYHLRVDGLGLLQIGAWFAMIAYVLALGVFSCLSATFVHDQFDWIWIAIVLGQMIAGCLALQLVVGHPLIVKHGRGVDRLVRDHLGLWGAVALRLLDIGAFTGRMAAALMILDIHLPLTSVIVLAIVALAAGLIPFGRVGFREFCVVIVGSRLGAFADAGEIPWEQLALVESAGEAIVFIPLGIVLLLWYRRRWREGAAEGKA